MEATINPLFAMFKNVSYPPIGTLFAHGSWGDPVAEVSLLITMSLTALLVVQKRGAFAV